MIFIMLCLIICFGILGCNNTTITDATGSIKQTEKADESIENISPVLIQFDSVTDIVDFVSVTNSQEEKFNDYVEKHGDSKRVSYEDAKKFAGNYSKTKIFFNKNDISCDDFSGTYYVDRNELSLIYKIDGIIYRFIYSFDANAPHQYDGEPVLKDVKVGSFELDLYQGDGCMVGSVIDGKTAIRIIVKSEQINDINFEVFTICNDLEN